jgi:hypothetical protein
MTSWIVPPIVVPAFFLIVIVAYTLYRTHS